MTSPLPCRHIAMRLSVLAIKLPLNSLLMWFPKNTVLSFTSSVFFRSVPWLGHADRHILVKNLIQSYMYEMFGIFVLVKSNHFHKGLCNRYWKSSAIFLYLHFGMERKDDTPPCKWHFGLCYGCSYKTRAIWYWSHIDLWWKKNLFLLPCAPKTLNVIAV